MFYSISHLMHGDRKHIRLPGWDYSSEGVYFITICCHEGESFFGKLIDNKMVLSEIGKMASYFWKEIPVHFKHVKLDEYVVMPNHIHGILILDYSLVGTRHGVSLQRIGTNQFSKPVENSVSVIVNQYKSSLKRWCNQNGYKSFQWQSRFYDHIVRDENSIDLVREYIKSNPANWYSDKMFK